MAIHYAVAEHCVLKKRKEEEESSWVKLKAFLTNVGWPNNELQNVAAAMHCKSQVRQPIRFCLIAFLLLIPFDADLDL